MSNSWSRVGLLSLSLALAGGCDMLRGHGSDAKPAGENAVKTDMANPATPADMSSKSMAPVAHKMAVANIRFSKAATTQPINNHVTGKVTFTDLGGKLEIVADISGLEPNSTHGFHIHEKADITAADLSSAGGHFDPTGTHKHGDPDSKDGAMNMIHAGDLGNLVADDKGNAHMDRTVTDLTIDGDKNGVIGHSVIIHGKADDLKSPPAGNSGPRIAGGDIVALPTAIR